MEEGNSKKILIIDDNEELVLVLSKLLNARGYVTAAAYDSMFGVSLAHKGGVDLILLDMGLPAGGGLFVLQNLKKSVNTSHIPVLILTANSDHDFKRRALDLGAAAYLNKPFEPEDLLAHIAKNIK